MSKKKYAVHLSSIRMKNGTIYKPVLEDFCRFYDVDPDDCVIWDAHKHRGTEVEDYNHLMVDTDMITEEELIEMGYLEAEELMH